MNRMYMQSSTVNSVTIIFVTIKIIAFLFYKYHYPMFLLISICVYAINIQFCIFILLKPEKKGFWLPKLFKDYKLIEQVCCLGLSLVASSWAFFSRLLQ